jgi:hypothetical protein
MEVNDENFSNLSVSKTSKLGGIISNGRTTITISSTNISTIGINMVVNSSLVEIINNGVVSDWSLSSITGSFGNVIDGQQLRIYNRSSAIMTIVHDSVTVGASDQFKILTPTGVDVAIPTNADTFLFYNSGLAKWISSACCQEVQDEPRSITNTRGIKTKDIKLIDKTKIIQDTKNERDKTKLVQDTKNNVDKTKLIQDGIIEKSIINNIDNYDKKPFLPSIADFYALVPGDNLTAIHSGEDISFPKNGSIIGQDIIRANASSFKLVSIGTYMVQFQISVTESGQLVLTLNGKVLPNTVTGRSAENSQIVQACPITTTTMNSILTVRNPIGNKTDLTLTPFAGGSNPVSAHLVIIRCA